LQNHNQEKMSDYLGEGEQELIDRTGRNGPNGAARNVTDAQFSAAELKSAGFTAKELKVSGLDLLSLQSIGFTSAQLKAAGFDASAFKCAEIKLPDLIKLGFNAIELKDAGFDFSTLKSGFNPKQLKDAGFDSSVFKEARFSVADLKKVGFSAQEIMFPGLAAQNSKSSGPHLAIRALTEQRVASARVIGQSWLELLGFLAPFGTRNSFWNRLRRSPTFRHFFIYDSRFAGDLEERTLLEESPSPRVSVADVDSSVNNCALICALLLSIPCGLMTSWSENTYLNVMIHPMADYQPAGSPWVCALDVSNLQNTTFPSNCKTVFMRKFLPMFNNMLACFFACLFTLISVVLYYMFRPSEAYNNSPLVELLKAFTLDVRRQIREEMHSAGPPEEPFENRALECEVFFKAKFLAANEAEEQKNIG
jgi:hypothetical protein